MPRNRRLLCCCCAPSQVPLSAFFVLFLAPFSPDSPVLQPAFVITPKLLFVPAHGRPVRGHRAFHILGICWAIAGERPWISATNLTIERPKILDTPHLQSVGTFSASLSRHVVSGSAGIVCSGDDRHNSNIIRRHRGGNPGHQSSAAGAVVCQHRIGWDGISIDLLAHDGGDHRHVGHGTASYQDAVENPGGRTNIKFAHVRIQRCQLVHYIRLRAECAGLSVSAFVCHHVDACFQPLVWLRRRW